jgi:hypothetical protein
VARGQATRGARWRPCYSARSPVQKVFISKHVREALQRWAVELEDLEHVGVPMACREWVPAYGAPGVGVIYADASGEEGLSDNKRARYATLCRAVSISQVGVHLAEFRELLGKLTFASIVYPKGRQWVAPCWRSFKIAVKRLRHRASDHTCPRCSDISAALRRPQKPTEVHARALTADTESRGSSSSAALRS